MEVSAPIKAASANSIQATADVTVNLQFPTTPKNNYYPRAMAPTTWSVHRGPTISLHFRRDRPIFGNWRDVHNTESYILEGWGEGFMFGSLLMMVIITVVNMRRGILLHKVILLEVSGKLEGTSVCR
jgi:hypothetical protein